jgi:hypothetical protein
MLQKQDEDHSAWKASQLSGIEASEKALSANYIFLKDKDANKTWLNLTN